MTQRSSWRNLTGKQLAALVYVAIALAAVGLAATETYASVQWYTTASGLELHVSNAIFHPENNTQRAPYVAILASVYNPAGYDQLFLSDSNYGVWVNSTGEAFNPPSTGSTEVGLGNSPIQHIIPGGGTLNISYDLPMIPSIVVPLHIFLNGHNRTDLVTYVGVTLYFQSTFGRFSVPYCYLLPSNVFTDCPPPIEGVKGHGG